MLTQGQIPEHISCSFHVKSWYS